MSKLLPCALNVALLIVTSVAQAQIPSSGSYYEQQPYLPTVEPLIPADPLESCEFNRPPAAFGSFAFDFLVLNRSDANPFNLVTVDGVDALNVADLDFDETGAFRFTATFPSSCGVDFQFSYLGSHEFSARQSFSGAVVRDEFFRGFGTQTNLSVTYEAPLDSFELNLRARQWERFAPLVGIRFIGFDESSTQVDTTSNIAFIGDAMNTMVGIQFGGEWLLGRVGKWRIESVLKAGAYYNDINIEMFAAALNRTDQFSTTSFVGEASLTAVYPVTRHANFRIGYQGLWLEGTALIYDQYSSMDTSGNGSLDLSNANFQGGFAGFDLTW